MRLVIGLIILLQCQNCCYSQVEFNSCKMFEEFFGKVRFEEIPYFKPDVPKPKILLSEAKDTLIQIIDPQTYESTFVNEKTLVREQWNKFNQTEKFVSKRDIVKNSFHLINTDVELRDSNYIKDALSKYFQQISIETSKLIPLEYHPTCEAFNKYNNERFLLNVPLTSLTEEQSFNMRGYFRFGPVFLTEGKEYAVTTYDIYHKWIGSNGEMTNMETGGGGIILINLLNDQLFFDIN